MKFIRLVIGPLENNCYILSGDGLGAVIIDPTGNFPEITAALDGAGLAPSAVLLTHGHFDHIGAAKRLQDAGAEIYIHAGDIDKIGSGMGFGRVTPFTLDKTFSDGEILQLAGLEIKIIHTPGHTSGGVCFYCSFENVLFTGDTLFNGDIGRTDLPSGNYTQLIRSIKEKLFILPPCTKVFPGHGGGTTIGDEMKPLRL